MLSLDDITGEYRGFQLGHHTQRMWRNEGPRFEYTPIYVEYTPMYAGTDGKWREMYTFEFTAEECKATLKQWIDYMVDIEFFVIISPFRHNLT